MLPLECVVRGYLAGSGWKDYQRDGAVSGHVAPGRAARVGAAARADLHAVDEGQSRATTRTSTPHGRSSSSARNVSASSSGVSIALYAFASAYARRARDHPRRHEVRVRPRRGRAARPRRRGVHARLVAVLASRRLRAGRATAVVRQAVRPRLLRVARLGQDRSGTGAARRRRRGHTRTVRRGVRAPDRHRVRRLPRRSRRRARDEGRPSSVRPKPGILDPQGEAVLGSLRHLGFDVDGGAHRPRRRPRARDATDATQARAEVERMCEQLLANPLIESFEIELTDMRPRIAVIVFPGSNDDRDAALALERLGADPVLVWHAEQELPDCRRRRPPRRLLVRRLPPLRRDRALRARDGGGERLRRRTAGSCSASATASRSSARRASCPACCVRTRRCRSSAATWRSASSATDTPFTARASRASGSSIPVKHGEGCYLPACRSSRTRAGRAPLRSRVTTRTARSTTSPASSRRGGNVMGLMPHPEHAVDPLLGSTDGALHPRLARRRRSRGPACLAREQDVRRRRQARAAGRTRRTPATRAFLRASTSTSCPSSASSTSIATSSIPSSSSSASPARVRRCSRSCSRTASTPATSRTSPPASGSLPSTACGSSRILFGTERPAQVRVGLRPHRRLARDPRVRVLLASLAPQGDLRRRRPLARARADDRLGRAPAHARERPARARRSRTSARTCSARTTARGCARCSARCSGCYVERDPLDAAVSILDARRKHYDDPRAWWSYVPLEYDQLRGPRRVGPDRRPGALPRALLRATELASARRVGRSRTLRRAVRRPARACSSRSRREARGATATAIPIAARATSDVSRSAAHDNREARTRPASPSCSPSSRTSADERHRWRCTSRTTFRGSATSTSWRAATRSFTSTTVQFPRGQSFARTQPDQDAERRRLADDPRLAAARTRWQGRPTTRSDSPTRAGADKHLKTVEMSYRRAPYFDDVFGIFRDGLEAGPTLVDVNLTLHRVARHVHRHHVEAAPPLGAARRVRPEERAYRRDLRGRRRRRLPLRHRGWARLHRRRRALATRHRARASTTSCRAEYPQLWGAFEPRLSILDVLFNCGAEGCRMGALGDAPSL